MAKAEAAQEQKSVTFYAWIESYPQAVPSSMTVRISGGQRKQDPNTGAIMPLDHKEVRFNMGLLHTDDPETIAVLRKLKSKGETITEDKEVYLAKIMKPTDQATRASKLLGAATIQLDEANEKIRLLEAQLAGKK